MLERIGKYEIRRQIGRGAMGVVHEGFDPLIERRVAIKTLRLELFEPSQLADVRARFKREAQSAGQLSHPHIVTIHEYGEHEGTPYIVMEFMVGDELSRILQRGARLPLSETVRLMTQLLGALAYAHEHKVVHRDIKPANILILNDGSLKVVDFGIAHVEASNLTDTGALLGTPAYMSPEQFLALPVDERSDIFSAGVILYELLTGDKPFTGSVTTIMQKVLHQEPLEPSKLNPTLSSAWDTVVKRAIAKKPEARYQSARQFAESVKLTFAAGTSERAGAGVVNVSVDVTLQGKDSSGQWGETLRPGESQEKPSKDSYQKPVSATKTSPTISRDFLAGWKIPAIVGVVIVIGAAYWLRDQWVPTIEDKQKQGSQQLLVAEAERAVAEKAAQEKTSPERTAAAKVAAERSGSERAAPAKAAAEPAPVARETTFAILASQKSAAETAMATKASAERVAALKAAVDKLAAEKEVAERAAAAEKAPAVPQRQEIAAMAPSSPAVPKLDAKLAANIFDCMSPGLPDNWKKTWLVITRLDRAGSQPKYDAKFYFATLPSDVEGEELVPCNAQEITRRLTGLSEALPPDRRNWRTATLVITREGEFDLKYDYSK